MKPLSLVLAKIIRLWILSFQGVWGNGSFTNMDDLTKTMATMVFILTNVHAAANFNQYEEYGFPPNYPFRLNGTPPTSKVNKTFYSKSNLNLNLHFWKFVFLEPLSGTPFWNILLEYFPLFFYVSEVNPKGKCKSYICWIFFVTFFSFIEIGNWRRLDQTIWC